MQLESIEVLNKRLVDYFGIDSNTGRPIFRITWANNETEKRRVSHTPEGIQLIHPTVMEVKKYPYLKDMYVLEQLVIVPDQNKNELVDLKLSYEPLWAYCDQNKFPIAPHWGATKLIVDTMYAAMGKKSMRKYVEDEKNTTPEGRDQRIKELQAELFGNETATTDALAYKEGVVVPSNYKKD